MTQLPQYNTQDRGAQAPKPGPPNQTQENNGGPKGFGQPQAHNRMSQPPQGRQQSPVQQAVAPQPPPGSGQPGGLYPPVPPNFQAQLWQNRNSLPPMDLISAAFMQLHGRPANPDEIQSLLQSSPNTDYLIEQLLNVHNPGQPGYMQQIVNPNPVF